MKIVCGALAALLFCVAGAIWYVYQKKAVFRGGTHKTA